MNRSVMKIATLIMPTKSSGPQVSANVEMSSQMLVLGVTTFGGLIGLSGLVGCDAPVVVGLPFFAAEPLPAFE